MAKSSCHTYGSYSIGRQYFKEKKKKKNICQQWLRKHRADKAFRKVRSLSKLRFRWTVNRFESPTFLSLNVVRHCKKNENIKNIDEKMKIKILLFLFVLAVPLNLNAQHLNLYW